jgi:hypothetical protein
MPDFDPVVRTRTLARIVGPYLVATAIMLFARQNTLPALLPAFMQDAPLVLATGAFTLMAGLTVFAIHHHWSRASAVTISLIGVAVALKGAWLMIAPDLGAGMTATVVRTPPVLLVVAVVEIVVGLWLSYVGWRSRA